MNKYRTLLKNSSVLFFLLLAILSGCEKGPAPLKLPEIISSGIFTLGSNSVTIKTTFNVESEDTVTNTGICWSLHPDPEIYTNFTSASLNDGIMYARIEGLAPDTRYYARVFTGNPEREFYGDEISFTTNTTITDIEGNLYNVVTIGSQNWMVENLRTTVYNDGSGIPYAGSNTDWTVFDTPGYSWYDYNIENKYLFGALYNWPVVNSGKLCPDGWHIPSDSEWSVLSDYLGGESSAGGFLKSTGNHWDSPNNNATNYAGFYGLPAGGPGAALGSFTGKGSFTIWWSSTVDLSLGSGDGLIMTRILLSENAGLKRDGFMARGGAINFLSVRCIKD